MEKGGKKLFQEINFLKFEQSNVSKKSKCKQLHKKNVSKNCNICKLYKKVQQFVNSEK